MVTTSADEGLSEAHLPRSGSAPAAMNYSCHVVSPRSPLRAAPDPSAPLVGLSLWIASCMRQTSRRGPPPFYLGLLMQSFELDAPYAQSVSGDADAVRDILTQVQDIQLRTSLPDSALVVSAICALAPSHLSR